MVKVEKKYWKVHLEVPVKYLASSTLAVLNTQARAGRSRTKAKLIRGAEQRTHVKSSNRWRARQMRGYSRLSMYTPVSLAEQMHPAGFFALPASISGSGEKWQHRSLFSPCNSAVVQWTHRTLVHAEECLPLHTGERPVTVFSSDRCC